MRESISSDKKNFDHFTNRLALLFKRFVQTFFSNSEFFSFNHGGVWSSRFVKPQICICRGI